MAEKDVYKRQRHGRGGQGVITIQTSERNGRVIGAVQVENDHELMLISDGGTLVRTRVGEISIVGRNAQGVKLISLQGDEKLAGVEKIEGIADLEGNGDANGEEDHSLASGEADGSDDGEGAE